MYKVTGVGSFLPNKVVTNEDITKIVDTSDSWIRERTGIKKRHYVEDELTSDLAAKAAQRALDDSGVKAEEIDMIIVATTTPDLTFPGTATLVQNKIGAKNAVSFDVQAACAGFIYGLSILEGFFESGKVKNALVIGAETLSKIIDFSDRTTCVLFGDGAGAFVLSKKEDSDTSGLIGNLISTKAEYTDLLKTSGGTSKNQQSGFIEMQGQEVFKHAVTNLKQVCLDLLEQEGIKKEDIDFLIPHQANKRIIDSTAKFLGLDKNKVIVTVDQHANTSAASIPLAFDWAKKEGRFKKGDIILLVGFGAGFTFGGTLIRW